MSDRGTVVRIVARLNTGGVAGPLLTQAIHGVPGYDQVLVSGRPEANEEEMLELLERLEGTVTYVESLRRSIDFRHDRAALGELVEVLDRTDPVIVETHTAKAGMLGRLAAALHNRKRRARGLDPAAVVHYFHGHVFRGEYFGRLKTTGFLQLERLLARFATTRIAVPCAQQADELAEMFGVGRRRDYRVVPYGVEMSIFRDGLAENRRSFRDELGIADEEVAIGIVGRLEPVKNHRLFLDGVARLRALMEQRGGAPVVCVVIGDGALRPELEAMARAKELADSVRFLGLRRDRSRFFAGLDILTLTSSNEGYPNVLLEAMATGVPVVSTEVGGVPDLVRNGWNGLLIPSGDSHALAEALYELCTRPERRRRLARNGRERVEANHSVRRMVAEVSRLWDELTVGSDMPTRRAS